MLKVKGDSVRKLEVWGMVDKIWKSCGLIEREVDQKHVAELPGSVGSLKLIIMHLEQNYLPLTVTFYSIIQLVKLNLGRIRSNKIWEAREFSQGIGKMVPELMNYVTQIRQGFGKRQDRTDRKRQTNEAMFGEPQDFEELSCWTIESRKRRVCCQRVECLKHWFWNDKSYGVITGVGGWDEMERGCL